MPPPPADAWGVVVAHGRTDGDGAVLFPDLVPEIPLDVGAGPVGVEAIHDGIAAGEDQFWFVFQGTDMRQARGQAFGGPFFGLDVDVGEVADAD